MTGRTVILDGFLGRPARWERLRRAVEARGMAAEIWRYDATGRTDLPTLGRQLAARYCGPGRGPVNFVGYSMGGLVVRTAALLDPAFACRRAVFINTPHAGTRTAYLWPWVGVRQMRPGSALLARLNASPWPTPTLVVYNRFDGVVIPAASTRWAAAHEHVRCPLPAHVWPVWSRTIHARVADFLADKPPAGR